VEGTWKEALTSLLVPLDRQASYLLAGRAETPDSLLLQDGARPNDQNYMTLMPGMSESDEDEESEPAEQKHVDISAETTPATTSEVHVDKAAEVIVETSEAPRVGMEEKKPVEVVSETSPSSALETKNEPATPTASDVIPSPAPETKEEKIAETVSPRIDTPAPFAIRWGMPQKLTWKDADEIAYALIDAHPDQDPLKLSFPKLHKLVTELEDFGDDPEKSSESILESIQMAWYEEVK